MLLCEKKYERQYYEALDFLVLADCVKCRIKFHPVTFSSVIFHRRTFIWEKKPTRCMPYILYFEPMFCTAISFGFEVSDTEYERNITK
jgi:hypothetical protein